MKEYQKIPTLYKFDNTIKRYIPEIYDGNVKYLENNTWLVSEKIDGTNIRVFYDGHRVSWSGRTDKAVLPKEVEHVLKSTFGDSEVLFEQIFGDKQVILFMECYGGKIQGGIYGGTERLIGFDIMVGDMYLDKQCIEPIFKRFGVPTVDFMEIQGLQWVINEVKDAGEQPNCYISPYCEKCTTTIEGFVCVPARRLYDNQGNRIIVKIKVRDLAKLEPRKNPPSADEIGEAQERNEK